MTLSLYCNSVLYTDLDLWVSLDYSILEDCLIGSLGVLQRDQRLAGHVVLAHSHHLRHRDAHGEDLLLPAQEGDTFLHCYTLGYIIIRPFKNSDRYMSVSHPTGRPSISSGLLVRRPPRNHSPLILDPSTALPWTVSNLPWTALAWSRPPPSREPPARPLVNHLSATAHRTCMNRLPPSQWPPTTWHGSPAPPPRPMD